MRILIIVGNCLRVNSSANLCHLAYIRGFIEYGCNVTVISMSDTGQIIDESIELPKPAEYHFFTSSILLNFIKPSSRKQLNKNMENKDKSLRTSIFNFLRAFILKQYGPFGYSKAWMDNTVNQFTGEEYDMVLSLSSPVTSHVVAQRLISKKRITCKTFCEIWEDPWQYDLYKEHVDAKLLEMEYEITRYADTVLYVSPITLDIQKSMFSLSAHKMDWLPLPYYYSSSDREIGFSKHCYGYFGDYFPHVRNLACFYEAAKEMNLTVNICGMPDNLFQKTNTICVNERIPLNELKKYEAITNVLVFVCNIKGGQIPGKIYQYAATAKKILFILDGTDSEKLIIKQYFEPFNRFYFCNNNKEDIIKTIIELESGARENIKNYCVDYFSPKNIAYEILKKNNLISD